MDKAGNHPISVRFSLRIVFALSLPVITLLGLILGFYYWNESSRAKAVWEVESLNQILNLEVLITNELDQVISDLKFLSHYHEIGKTFNRGPSDEIVSDFIAFSEARGVYDQIRILNADGSEILRVNYSNGDATNVPRAELQNKGDRYYFTDSIKLEPGQIYLSRLDLNKERGAVEVPYKPMIRLATPIQVDQTKDGIILLNYLAEKILIHFESDFDEEHKKIMLVNQDGYWLKASSPDKEWGFMFEDRRGIRIQNDYPEEWKAISAKQSGSFYSENGLFTYLTLYPNIITKPDLQYLKTDLLEHWKIIFYLPKADLEREPLALARKLIIVFIFLSLGALTGASILSVNITRRKATEAIIRQQHLSNLRFVPQEFLMMLDKKNSYEVHLSDCVQKPLTIVFSDIRSYTKISENLTDQETFHFLNSYFGQVSEQISNHNGFIDKYIGDAIMALFPESADDALLSAIDMKKSLLSFNEQRQNEGKEPVHCGFGVHFGEVTLGTIGIESRMETTAIGDAVNLASRLESITKTYKVCTIITEDVVLELKNPDSFNIRKIDTVRVKGKNRAIPIYEVFDTDTDDLIQQKKASLSLFQEALACYETASFEAAIEGFSECARISPEDPLPTIYLTRCNTMKRLGTKDDWQGVSTI